MAPVHFPTAQVTHMPVFAPTLYLPSPQTQHEVPGPVPSQSSVPDEHDTCAMAMRARHSKSTPQSTRDTLRVIAGVSNIGVVCNVGFLIWLFL